MKARNFGPKRKRFAIGNVYLSDRRPLESGFSRAAARLNRAWANFDTGVRHHNG